MLRIHQLINSSSYNYSQMSTRLFTNLMKVNYSKPTLIAYWGVSITNCQVWTLSHFKCNVKITNRPTTNLKNTRKKSKQMKIFLNILTIRKTTYLHIMMQDLIHITMNLQLIPTRNKTNPKIWIMFIKSIMEKRHILLAIGKIKM